MSTIRVPRPADAPDDEYLLSAVVRAIAAGTWDTRGGYERAVSHALAAEHGQPPGSGIRIPDSALRDLTTSSAGPLVSDYTPVGYVPSLQPVSVALRLGADVQTVPAGSSVAIPRGITAPSTSWLAGEAAEADESTPVLGSINGQPRVLSAFVELSRHFLLQAANGERILRAELRRAAGAALDRAVLAGSGVSGQPLGIVGTPGVGAFTGASLNQAALRDAQLDCAAAAEGRPVALVTTPTVADVLARRPRVPDSHYMLWEAATTDGVVEGIRAVSTGNCPTATAIVGDFQSITIVQWAGGMTIEVDPFSKFKASIVGVRLILPVDVYVTRPAAFSVATGVS